MERFWKFEMEIPRFCLRMRMSTLTLLSSRGGHRAASPALGFFQAATSLRKVSPNITRSRDLTWKIKKVELVRDSGVICWQEAPYALSERRIPSVLWAHSFFLNLRSSPENGNMCAWRYHRAKLSSKLIILVIEPPTVWELFNSWTERYWDLGLGLNLDLASLLNLWFLFFPTGL